MKPKIKNVEDAIMKNVADVFKDDVLKFFGIDKKIITSIRTEMKNIDVQTSFMDYTFLLEDNTIIHLEFQTTYTPNDIRRFLMYNSMLQYKENKDVTTVVIFSANVNNIKSSIITGKTNYSYDYVLLKDIDGDKKYNYLKNKIMNNEDLTKQDLLTMVLLPVMKNSSNKNERMLDIIELSKKVPNEQLKLNVQSLLYAFASKIVDDEYWSKIKEVFYMTKLGEMLRKDFIQEGMEKGIQEGMEKGIQEGMEKGIQKGMEKGIQKGMEKGIQKGMEKGKKESLTQMALKFLIKKFGKLTEEQKNMIRNADIEELQLVIDGILDYKKIEEAFKYLK